MKEVMREEKAFNGNVVRLEYNPSDLGNKYKIRFRKPDEYGFRFACSFANIGEAHDYFNKIIEGGR